jgi:hypothetical protein
MSNDFFPLKNGLHQTPPSSFSLHQAVVAKPRNQRKKEKMTNITIATTLQYKIIKTPQQRLTQKYFRSGISNNKPLQFLNLITGG